VTIPKPLRDSLAIRPGTQLEFHEKDGALVARPVQPRDPVDRLVGLLPKMDVDAALELLRGPAWNPEMDQAKRGHRR
jgi:AbrB family looped-hinge helix DNA binding protein